MHSNAYLLIGSFLITLIVAQQVADSISEEPSAEKRMRSFAFAKRSPPRQFRFAKKSDEAMEDEEEEVEKRARFAFAKRLNIT